MRFWICVVTLAILSASTASFGQDVVFIESANALDDYLSLQPVPVLQPISSGAEKTDGRIIWHPALAGQKGILFASLESGDGMYLRRKDDALVVEKDDGTPQFAADASFKVKFNSGGSLTLESVGRPGYFVRHHGPALALERSDHTPEFEGDSSYFRISPDSR